MKVFISCGAGFNSDSWTCPSCGEHPPQLGGFDCFAASQARQNDGFAPEYFEQLAAVESGNFWFESRSRVIQWGMHTYLPNTSSFLEIGCGTGFVLTSMQNEFPGMQLFGSEIFLDGLRFAARRLPGVRLFQMDARNIPFDSEFDAAGALDVIEHIEEDQTVLSEMRRAVKPGGGVLITVPQHPFLWSAVDEHAFHKRRYTKQELARKLRQAGFEVLHMTSFMTLLLPLMVLSRLRQKRRSRESAGTELEVNRFVNGCLLRFSVRRGN